ncbi:MAG: TolC family protein [Nitrospinae bacterium]|nr:TolC family protein [Nitrospinota bacterium]
MRKLFILSVMTALAAGTAFAAGPPAASFAGYLRLLYENHPELKALSAERDAKNQVPAQEYSLPNPQLTLGVMDLPTDTLSFNQEDMTQKVVGLSQAFPAPGKRELRRKTAEADVEMSEAMVGEKRLELAEQARLAFYELKYLLKSRETVLKNKDVLHGFIESALTKYSAGMGVQQDVLAAQMEFSRTAEVQIMLEQEIATATSNLNVWAGLPADTDWSRPEIDALPSMEADEAKIAETAVAKRPLFRQMGAALRKSGDMLQLARKEILPDYSVSLSYGIRENGAMPRSNMISAEVMLDLPLYRRTKQDKMVAQSVLMEEKARLDVESEKLKLRREVAEQLQMQKKDERLLTLYDAGLLPQARQAVEAAFSSYRVNKVDFRWLIMNQAALLDYQLQRHKVEYELLATRTRLLKISGGDETEVKNEN